MVRISKEDNADDVRSNMTDWRGSELLHAPNIKWASSSGWGEFLTFVKDRPNRYQQVKAMLRGYANGN